MDLILAHGEPAGGAALHEILWASGVALVLIAGLGWFGSAHRSNKTTVLTRLGDFSATVSGLPAWAALPAAIASGALLVAVYGFYWDVATHIDNGRDPGPFANPSHFFIIFGLFGIAVAGYVGVLLGTKRESSTSVRIREGWNVPLGAILLMVCGLIAVGGFPLDDIWHRLFGQDVTLWGPTHIQMVGGAALSTLALWVLVVEGIRDRAEAGKVRPVLRVHETLVAGAFLLGASALQAEFDYSVPQFRLLFHPVMLALAAGIALVPARIRLGRGAALKAVAFFLVVRGILSVVVGPVLGHTTLHFPLYIGEALLVELVALRINPARYVTFGAWSGAAIGTLGVAAEWAWSNTWMTMSWGTALLPEIALAAVAGIAGGVLGGRIGGALSGAPRNVRSMRVAGLAAGAAIVLCLAYPLPISDAQGSATVALDDPSAHRTTVTVTLDPPTLADDAEWFNITAWQGGGSVVGSLEPLGNGTYRATDIPIGGEWKTLVRLHTGSAIVAVPVYMPADPAIPAEEVPAESSVTRPFVPDKQLLLREAKDTPSWFSMVGYSALGLIVVVWIAGLAWGLRRMRDDGPAGHDEREVRWSWKASTT
ncbi:MAG: hypothetical protein QOG04_608 [Actinomycetota bacterium]|jgi:hypothetical protein|nr:hypothetical protein [Actinomycetota bacterium]